jgi:hypothetical protein
VLIVDIPKRGAPPPIQTVRTGSLEWLSFRRKIEQTGQMDALVAELDQLSAPERTLVECVLEGTLFGPEHEALSKVLELVEGRFLFGRADATRLVPDDTGPQWIEQLPEGYLRSAAQALLDSASADPPDLVAAAALRDFSMMWREVKQ